MGDAKTSRSFNPIRQPTGDLHIEEEQHETKRKAISRSESNDSNASGASRAQHTEDQLSENTRTKLEIPLGPSLQEITFKSQADIARTITRYKKPKVVGYKKDELNVRCYSTYQIVSAAFTIYAVLGPPLSRVSGNWSLGTAIAIDCISTATLLFFIGEMIFLCVFNTKWGERNTAHNRCWCLPVEGYCLSGNFYMDLIAIISLVEAPVELIFAASGSCAQLTLSDHIYYTFSRLARLTRIAPLVLRLMRLQRISRLLRLHLPRQQGFRQQMRRYLLPTWCRCKDDDEEEVEGDTPIKTKKNKLSETLVKRATMEVVIGCLLMLMVVPFLQGLFEPGYDRLYEQLHRNNYERREGWEIGLWNGIYHNSELLAVKVWPARNISIATSHDVKELGRSTDTPDTSFKTYSIPELLEPQKSAIACDKHRDRVFTTKVNATFVDLNTNQQFNDTLYFSTAFVRDVAMEQRKAALEQILFTVCVLVVLITAFFSYTTLFKEVVQKPISRMMRSMANISRNLLKPITGGADVADELEQMDDDEKITEVEEHAETVILEQHVHKMALLVRLGYGDYGASIVAAEADLWELAEDARVLPKVVSYKEAPKKPSIATMASSESVATISSARDIDIESYVDKSAGVPADMVFCVVRILHYPEIVSGLKHDAPLFLNRVAQIVHSTAHAWGGWPVHFRNGEFLIKWQISAFSHADSDPNADPSTSNPLDDNIAMPPKTPLASETDGDFTQPSGPDELANNALVAILKMIVRIKNSSDIQEFSNDHRIRRRAPNFRVKLSLALHLGSGIDCVVGSKYKVDPVCLSGDCRIASQLARLAEIYQVETLMSSAFKKALPQNVHNYLRRLDVVLITKKDPRNCQYMRERWIRAIDSAQSSKASEELCYLFTYDVWDTATSKRLGIVEFASVWDTDVLMPTTSVSTVPEEESGGERSVFEYDSDLLNLRMAFSKAFRTAYSRGFRLYLLGQWSKAKDELERACKISPHEEGDPPGRLLLNRMKRYNFEAPEAFRKWFCEF